MYKLIIVDDEAVIRKGIRDYIDWKSMGFEPAETFEDGKEAIAYMETCHVDVVLTDIEMAEVSGLEMARHVRDSGLASKVVIISGYKEFEYARKAVEYGVEHYLLKPIRMEEVTEVFTKIKMGLDAKKAEQEEKLHARQHFAEILPELREQFWISLLVGGLKSRENISKRKQVLGIELDEEKPFLLANLKVAAGTEGLRQHFEGESYHNLIHNIWGGETYEIFSFPIFFSDDVIRVVMTTGREETKEEFRMRAESLMQEKCEAADSLLKLNMTAEVEEVFTDLMELTDCHCILTGSRAEVRREGEDVQLSSEDYECLMQKYKLLMGSINDGELEELDSLIDSIFFEFRSMPVEQVQQLCIDLFSMLSGKLLRMGIDMWKVLNKKLSYQEILSIQELRGLKEKTKSLFHEVRDGVRCKQNISSKKFVEESIRYMKDHFAEEISLEHIANRFFLNQTYFSRLFKQYTGSTFTDYLIELRMEKAKELLSQGRYKVYEVSQMVGYRSEKYFFRIFKQYAGCSPTEYYRGKNLDEG